MNRVREGVKAALTCVSKGGRFCRHTVLSLCYINRLAYYYTNKFWKDIKYLLIFTKVCDRINLSRDLPLCALCEN